MALHSVGMQRTPIERAIGKHNHMDIYAHLAGMKPLVAASAWDRLEATYHALAAELAGPEQADVIARLDFPSYGARLQPCFMQALQAAARCRATAVYFEYDLDNDWQSNFFLCEKYSSESADDDDWACDWIEDCSGPDFPEASEVYLENHFDRTPTAKGSTLYLVARTVAAFGRCFEQAASPAITTCIAFHDQTPVLRIFEAG